MSVSEILRQRFFTVFQDGVDLIVILLEPVTLDSSRQNMKMHMWDALTRGFAILRVVSISPDLLE